MTSPNGIGLSPDEKTLYVANFEPGQGIWMGFPSTPKAPFGKGKPISEPPRPT